MPVSKDDYKIRKRKVPCEHEEAKFDGNYDWPGLVCVKCGKKVSEKDYED